MASYTADEAFLRTRAVEAWDERWKFAWDMNGDGLITISDTWLWLKWLFFAPGDAVLLVIMRIAPSVGLFFEMTPATTIFGFGSGLISFFSWMIAWGILTTFVEEGRMR